MPDHVSTVPPPRTLDLAPANPAALIVNADGWFPPISITDFQLRHRVSTEIPTPRIRTAIQNAMSTVLIDLSPWSVRRRLQGHTSLADVPVTTIDGVSHYVICWERAVMALAKDELMSEYRDYDATASGERNQGFLDEAQMDLKTAAQHAIRDFLGQTRQRVQLI
jgi:hypothetical protein